MIHRVLGAAVACLLLIFSVSSHTEQTTESSTEPAGLVISSGGKGGGYWNAAERLRAVTGDLGSSMENRPSDGSLANLEKLAAAASPVNLAFAQADALQYYLYDNPEFGPKIEILENIGQECVFIVASQDSDVRTDADLQQADNFRLGLPSHTSGVAVTFNYMVRQIPELAGVQAVYGDPGAAAQQLHSQDATVDAVMVVHRPREHSATVDLALRHPERYRFLEISDERLTKALADGREVYRRMDLAMRTAEDETPVIVNTVCVKGLLVANREKLSDGQQNLLSEVVNNHWMRVFATE
jgi:TRAP-type uncharacterized transport system substrate-binding protein